jgi:hypothetical protein
VTTKAAGCTCRHPEVRYRTLTGHYPFCPVNQARLAAESERHAGRMRTIMSQSETKPDPTTDARQRAIDCLFEVAAEALTRSRRTGNDDAAPLLAAAVKAYAAVLASEDRNRTAQPWAARPVPVPDWGFVPCATQPHEHPRMPAGLRAD